jgi:hypothetical protein
MILPKEGRNDQRNLFTVVIPPIKSVIKTHHKYFNKVGNKVGCLDRKVHQALEILFSNCHGHHIKFQPLDLSDV